MTARRLMRIETADGTLFVPALLDRLPWRPGTGICGERRGVLALETADAATRARLERLALGCITDEAAFFAAPSL